MEDIDRLRKNIKANIIVDKLEDIIKHVQFYQSIGSIRFEHEINDPVLDKFERFSSDIIDRVEPIVEQLNKIFLYDEQGKEYVEKKRLGESNMW